MHSDILRKISDIIRFDEQNTLVYLKLNYIFLFFNY